MPTKKYRQGSRKSDHRLRLTQKQHNTRPYLDDSGVSETRIHVRVEAVGAPVPPGGWVSVPEISLLYKSNRTHEYREGLDHVFAFTQHKLIGTRAVRWIHLCAALEDDGAMQG